MMTPADRAFLDEQIAHWRGYVRRRQAVDQDAAERESHLRQQVMALTEAGLTVDEAFLIAVKRTSGLDASGHASAREHTERLWKPWVLDVGRTDRSDTATRVETLVVLGLAVAAGAAIKVPALFGLRLDGDGAPFYARNASLFVLPLLTAYFAWKRRASSQQRLRLVAAFVAGAVFVNIFPFRPWGDTQILSSLHVPIALWLAVGDAHVRGGWFTGHGRMDFVRFSGELAIYYVLIALGGGVLTAFTMMMFTSIGMNAEWLAEGWLIPCGAMGAVIIASWLVEARQRVIEQMAPVLTRLFTPLFTILLIVFLATLAWTGNPINVQRELLIGFDLLLALVVGLVLYAISGRDPQAPPDFFDRLQLLLVVCALAVDLVALAAIAARISEFGFTPNRVAALGENLILLASLAGSAWFYARFLVSRATFDALERWQIACLPVYSAWAALVVVAFPPVFGYR